MCDQEYFEKDRLEYEARGLITRRQFGVLVAAGISMALPAVANAQATGEKDVEIKTPDGTADAYFVYPSTGSAAAVLIWPDIFGLRPAMRTMAKRLASSGYSVLVVNPFYRVGKPTATGATPIAEMLPFRKGMSQAGDMSDAKAFIAWLDQQPQVNRNRKIGTQGYCMGGPMTFNTASAVPDRVGAVASFHGGGLVTKEGDPNSPHVLAAATKASFLIAIAETDDKQRPMEKDVLKATFAKANRPAEIEVYPAAHGWCPPDTTVYNEPAAEKAWARLLALYKTALA
ncbi:MAG TPA: dienelactone hydrolase family protein [Vicinamibacterales bacterium]|jgi:carboxymethylenebutenolidase|nr:dienelactone hydrolase family protein [Vicinamibacterales bacterium]